MRQEVLRLDEVTLLAIGLDKVTVAGFREIARVVGSVTGGATVPEVVAQTTENTASVVVLVTTTEELQAMALEIAPPDNAVTRRFCDIEAVLERSEAGNGRLLRELAEMQAEQERAAIDYQRLIRRIADLEAGNT